MRIFGQPWPRKGGGGGGGPTFIRLHVIAFHGMCSEAVSKSGTPVSTQQPVAWWRIIFWWLNCSDLAYDDTCSALSRSGAVRRPKEPKQPQQAAADEVNPVVETVQREIKHFIMNFFVNLHKTGALEKATAKALADKTREKVLNQPDYTDPHRAKVTPERQAKIRQLMEKEVAKALR